jgi:hypothetical protein
MRFFLHELVFSLLFGLLILLVQPQYQTMPLRPVRASSRNEAIRRTRDQHPSLRQAPGRAKPESKGSTKRAGDLRAFFVNADRRSINGFVEIARSGKIYQLKKSWSKEI